MIALAIQGLGIGGTIGVLGAAMALGFRHGIDWDHIAAITDITSTAAKVEDRESWLTSEPGVMLTDESHHGLLPIRMSVQHQAAVATAVAAPHGHSVGELGHRHNGRFAPGVDALMRQRPALLLGTMYALGHGSMVVGLGLLALLARQVLPAWLDPIMERVVVVTLILLAAYLFYSVVQYFRGGEEFRIRSRWMLVFAGVRNAFSVGRAKLLGRPHEHVHEAQQYGVKTAYAVGLIHGIGAETGTQVLVIATAVGAGSRAMGTAALGAFVVGLLISNSIVTIISTAGFASSQKRQRVYVIAGLVAAVFSLFVGVFFVLHAAGTLPNLDRYFHWVGGGGASG